MQLLHLPAQGLHPAFCAAGGFHPEDGAGDVSTYRFNKQAIAHHFCATCGIAPFAEAADPKGNKMAAINLRCVDGVDPQKLAIQHFDGRSL